MRLFYLLQTPPTGVAEAFLKHAALTPQIMLWLGFPDPVKYHRVVHLVYILDWCIFAQNKHWIQLEEASLCIPWLGIALDLNPPSGRLHCQIYFKPKDVSSGASHLV